MEWREPDRPDDSWLAWLVTPLERAVGAGPSGLP
jgi:hypothetical protein